MLKTYSRIFSTTSCRPIDRWRPVLPRNCTITTKVLSFSHYGMLKIKYLNTRKLQAERQTTMGSYKELPSYRKPSPKSMSWNLPHRTATPVIASKPTFINGLLIVLMTKRYDAPAFTIYTVYSALGRKLLVIWNLALASIYLLLHFFLNDKTISLIRQKCFRAGVIKIFTCTHKSDEPFILANQQPNYNLL